MVEFKGIDVLLDADGDLVVGPTGDLELAHGMAAFQQDVLDRLATLPGELPAHPQWGCRIKELWGAINSPRNQMLALRYIREALENEPRIASETIFVQQVGFTSEEKVFRIRFSLAGESKLQEMVWGLGIDGPFVVDDGVIIK